MADWTRCRWRTYNNGLNAIDEAMGYKCMVAFKYLFFKGHEDDYTQAKYEQPEETIEEFEENLAELRRKYPDGFQNADIEPDKPPMFTVDEKDARQVLLLGIIALVNKLGIKGMLEFMSPYEDGEGGYTEGWTKRPKGLAETIIQSFRDSLNAEPQRADELAPAI